MPAIVRATVVRWEVKDPEKPIVTFGDSTSISVYVGEGSDETEASLISAYILREPADRREKLLKAARDGLLKVIEISEVSITPPPVPPSHKPVQLAVQVPGELAEK